MLERDLDKHTATKTTLEQQVFALENANINMETMKAMRAGAEAMKGIHGSLYRPHLPVPKTLAVCRAVLMVGIPRKWIQSWTRFANK
jgi:hypothetical protein